MGKLTAKQERFVEEYLVDLNATQAAARAGYQHPNKQGPRLSVNVGVAKAIAAAQAERVKRTEITQDYVLAVITDTIERCQSAKAVTDHDGKETGEWTFNASAVLRGAELLGKHLAMFTDKQNVTHHDGDRQEVQERADAFTERLAGMVSRSKADKGETQH